MDSISSQFVMGSLQFLSTLFVFAVGLVLLGIVVLYILDVSQTGDAVRRNYPVLGRFRYLFSTLGEFFRQYFFAMDREEMPFNRAEREWVDRAARNKDNTIAFGSSKNLTPPGTAIFVNCPFPTLEEDAAELQPLEIGPYCETPYVAPSLFNISGMSYGALSTPAVLALSKGAAIANCWLNTGEGGLSPHHLEGGCDIVFQIGTAKYGVRDADGNLSDDKLREVAAHKQVRMFELKMSQGAKPGKGGILPGIKVTPEIAAIRGIPAGEDSISPNRHPEIDNAGQMLDMIERIRNVTGKPVGFKAVVGAFGWLEAMCQDIHARGIESAPDFITVDGGDGGTGAAPMALMDNVGLTVRESLPLVVDILVKYGLRERIRVIVSGKLVTPSEVAWALASGADFRDIRTRFHVFARLYPGAQMQQEHLPHGHHHAQQAAAARAQSAEQGCPGCRLLQEHDPRGGDHRPFLWRAPAAAFCGRMHVRIVQDNGQSIPMDTLFPEPEVLPEYRSAAAAQSQSELA